MGWLRDTCTGPFPVQENASLGWISSHAQTKLQARGCSVGESKAIIASFCLADKVNRAAIRRSSHKGATSHAADFKCIIHNRKATLMPSEEKQQNSHRLPSLGSWSSRDRPLTEKNRSSLRFFDSDTRKSKANFDFVTCFRHLWVLKHYEQTSVRKSKISQIWIPLIVDFEWDCQISRAPFWHSWILFWISIPWLRSWEKIFSWPDERLCFLKHSQFQQTFQVEIVDCIGSRKRFECASGFCIPGHRKGVPVRDLIRLISRN